MPAPQAAPPDTPAEPSLGAAALGTAALIRDLLGDALGLLALEARLAGLSLAGIVAAAVAAAFAVLAFWLLLQAGLIVAFGRLGIDVLWLLAAFALLNGAGALLLLLAIRRLSRNLMFKATAGALGKGGANAEPAARNSP